MLGFAVIGAFIAGGYGILHDQITYSISPEYFTKLKFHQFQNTDFGFPVRVRVAEIGFLATWWVGFFSAWFLARIAVPAWPEKIARRKVLAGVSIILAFALSSGLAGGWLGSLRRSNPDFSAWQSYAVLLGVNDLPAFVQVAYIHNAGYIGGLLGLVAALVFLNRKNRKRGMRSNQF